MKVASLKNSQRLHELTGWGDTSHTYLKHSLQPRAQVYAIPYDEPDGLKFLTLSGELEYRVPAYDLEYLTDRTPLRDNDITNTFMLGRTTNNDGWSAVYRDIVVIDRTAVDAVAGLLIKLYDKGE